MKICSLCQNGKCLLVFNLGGDILFVLGKSSDSEGMFRLLGDEMMWS